MTGQQFFATSASANFFPPLDVLQEQNFFGKEDFQHRGNVITV